nr:hypothetical protein GCM10020063_061330 [Dactylosporangium thailandense]
MVTGSVTAAGSVFSPSCTQAPYWMRAGCGIREAVTLGVGYRTWDGRGRRAAERLE